MQKKEKLSSMVFLSSAFSLCIFVVSRVIKLWQNNEELRNKNDSYLVIQFSNNPISGLILKL